MLLTSVFDLLEANVLFSFTGFAAILLFIVAVDLTAVPVFCFAAGFAAGFAVNLSFTVVFDLLAKLVF